MTSVPVLETERLYLRPLAEDDLIAVHAILGDERVMYAWEHAFTEEETREWLAACLSRYAKDGFSHFAVIRKDTGLLIGLVGPIREILEGQSHIGLGWLLRHDQWKRGFAYEAANAALSYAFLALGADTVIADIRPENTPSCRLAEKLGMKPRYTVVKHYRGKDMPHTVYRAVRSSAD